MHPCDQASWRLNWESQRSRSALSSAGGERGFNSGWGRVRMGVCNRALGAATLTRERGRFLDGKPVYWSLSNRGHNEAGGITGNNECQVQHGMFLFLLLATTVHGSPDAVLFSFSPG